MPYPLPGDPVMLRLAASQPSWFQELLFILAGTVCLFALTALIMAPRKHGLQTDESQTYSREPSFDPRKNGRGTFFPWLPVA